MEFIKVQRLSKTSRVVIEPINGKYRIAAQQYTPNWCYPWEVRADGWSDTVAQYSATLEGAKRVFEDTVRREQRYLELA